jgi:hypothetical protein
MAGIKITDLAALSTAATDDYLCIVDVSDTSQSPEGTTKKIEVVNIVDMESGTWTPIFSDFVGALTAATLESATYLRIGNIVTCQIYLFIDMDFTAPVNSGEFEFTYPIATTTANGGGSLSCSNESKQLNGSVRNNNISILSEDTTLDTTGTCHAIFQYEIN